MPGYVMQSDGSLRYGARKPLPSGVPQGGWNSAPRSPGGLAAMTRVRAQQAQAALSRPPGPSIPNGWSDAASHAMLRRPGDGFNGDEYGQLHPTRGMDATTGHPGLFGVSGAAGYGQGLTSMAGRNQLERNLDNVQVNHRLGINAAMAGRPSPAFGQYVGGSHPDQGMALAHARAFPSSTGQDVDHLVNAHLQGLGIASTAPKVGAIVGSQVASAIASAGIAGQSRPPVAIPTPPELPAGLMNQLMASVGAQANARTLPGGMLDYSNGAPSEIIAPAAPRLAGPELAPDQTPEMLAALPLQRRHITRTSFGAGGRSFQVVPGIGPQLDGATGGPAVNPDMAWHQSEAAAAKAKGDMQSYGLHMDAMHRHATMDRYGENAHDGLTEGLARAGEARDRATLNAAQTAHLAAETRKAELEAKFMGQSDNPEAHIDRLVANQVMDYGQGERLKERFKLGSALKASMPDYATHLLPPDQGGDPVKALAEILQHGHSEGFLNDPMGSEANTLRGYMRNVYGHEALTKGGRSPWPWAADDERSAKIRAFLNGTPYRPAVPTPGRSVALPTPPTVPVPRPPARSHVSRFLDAAIGRPRITFE